jgi:hypothetical protein
VQRLSCFHESNLFDHQIEFFAMMVIACHDIAVQTIGTIYFFLIFMLHSSILPRNIINPTRQDSR